MSGIYLITDSNSRNSVADLAKGIAVLLMVQVHLMELFATQDIFDSALGSASLFLGGPFVAPMFMAVLGYFVAASKRNTYSLLKRSLGLLLAAFFLNLTLNLNLLLKIRSGTLEINPWPFVFGVDILFLASFSIAILAILRLILKKSVAAYIVLAVVIVGITPGINANITSLRLSPYALAYVGGNASWSYFPLFPWLAYPLLGFGFYLMRSSIVTYFSKSRRLMVVEIALVTTLSLTAKFGLSVSRNLESYYHHGPLFAAWTALLITFCIIAISLFDVSFGDSLVARFVKWCGRQVTTMYVVQWLIIGNLGTAFYKSQSVGKLAAWNVAILGTTCLVAFLLEKSRIRLSTRQRKQSFR